MMRLLITTSLILLMPSIIPLEAQQPTWSLVQEIQQTPAGPSYTGFGDEMAIDDGVLVIAEPQKLVPGLGPIGAIHIYELNLQNTWELAASFDNPSGEVGQSFGTNSQGGRRRR